MKLSGKVLNLATGSISTGARIKWLQAEIARLNSLPRTPERDKELEQHLYELRKRDPECIGEQRMADGRLVAVYHVGETKVSRRKYDDPRLERLFEIGEQFRIMQGATVTADVSLQDHPEWALLQGLDEYSKTAKGIELTQERDRLLAEVYGDRRAKAEADWAAASESAQAAYAKVKDIENRIATALEKAKVLEMEAELMDALRTTVRWVSWANDLRIKYSFLGERRHGVPLSEDAPASRPGAQVERICRAMAPRRVRVAG